MQMLVWLWLTLLALEGAQAQGECGPNVVQMVTRNNPPCTLRFQSLVRAPSQSAITSAQATGDTKYREALSREEAIVNAGGGVKQRTPEYHHFLSNVAAPGAVQAFRKYLQTKHRATEIGKAAAAENGYPQQYSGDMLLYLRIPVPETCTPTPRCDASSRYRTFDGSCTNLRNPKWGVAGEPYTRLLLPVYNDGIYEFRRARDGSPLPNSRLLRTKLIPDRNFKDDINVLAVMQWGQLVAHDVTQTPDQVGANGIGVTCCSKDGQQLSSSLVSQGCSPFDIPSNDEYYSMYGQRCMNMARGNATFACNCILSAGEQINLVNHVMDASFIYGFSKSMADGLRSLSGGQLRVQTVTGRQFLPQSQDPRADCDATSNTQTCYLAGDFRVNQNTQLSVLQIVWMREHNRIAGQLAKINTGWNDERLYQETRRIVGAMFQHITYNEMLPIYLGTDLAEFAGLKPFLSGYNPYYNDRITINTLNCFNTGSYRAFHGIAEGTIKMYNYDRCPMRDILLTDYMDNPTIIQQGNNYDQLLLGLVTQPNMKADQYSNFDLNNRLFHTDAPWGQDLSAFDIERGRDHGLPNYNSFRMLCGLPKAYSWDGFLDYISSEHVSIMATLYKHPDDVDLFVGGFLERVLPGTMLGPTFHCIAVEQFYRYKHGDRFYYEFENNGLGFTPAQLQEIRKSSLARLVCDNGDNITTMQKWGFRQVLPNNPKLSCQSSEIPRLDLTKWKA